jgi:hypothetical protein
MPLFSPYILFTVYKRRINHWAVSITPAYLSTGANDAGSGPEPAPGQFTGISQ